MGVKWIAFWFLISTDSSAKNGLHIPILSVDIAREREREKAKKKNGVRVYLPSILVDAKQAISKYSIRYLLLLSGHE